ncbi:MAG: hypothetical protein OXU20_24350, partial [Myxococcales bacterium]|nr:hypothetical protein [Myxococcales bacterium]MDD9967014.1 hypothetical protein [Myxococcales bacterium]
PTSAYRVTDRCREAALFKYGSDPNTLTLALEGDPLEVFHMGGHFKTCLSPDSFNFFSVISNAVDINKRVLYGRDPEGRVQGRCLLALTDAGGIVTFHPYSHDPKKDFLLHVREFVTELAREMNVLPVPGGSISNLVASEWYDDGPRDLAGRFEFLKDGSALRRKRQTVREDEFLDLVRSAFAPLDLNELTLPLVLGLPELQSRPELVKRLLPTIRALSGVSIDVLAMLARALTSHGHTAVAVEVFGPFARDYLLQTYRRVSWLDPLVMDLLLDRSPSDVLEVLRKTRRKGERSWPTETDGERLFFGAEAYRALNRRKKAIDLYRRAVEAHASKETKATAKQRIAELSE